MPRILIWSGELVRAAIPRKTGVRFTIIGVFVRLPIPIQMKAKGLSSVRAIAFPKSGAWMLIRPRCAFPWPVTLSLSLNCPVPIRAFVNIGFPLARIVTSPVFRSARTSKNLLRMTTGPSSAIRMPEESIDAQLPSSRTNRAFIGRLLRQKYKGTEK